MYRKVTVNPYGINCLKFFLKIYRGQKVVHLLKNGSVVNASNLTGNDSFFQPKISCNSQITRSSDLKNSNLKTSIAVLHEKISLFFLDFSCTDAPSDGESNGNWMLSSSKTCFQAKDQTPPVLLPVSRKNFHVLEKVDFLNFVLKSLTFLKLHVLGLLALY